MTGPRPHSDEGDRGPAPHAPPPAPHVTKDHDALVDKATAGDRDALVALLEALGGTVRARLATRITGHLRTALDPDDLMQVTYIEAVTRLDRFKGGGASGFLAWLTRLAENNLIDAVRMLEADKRPNPARRVETSRRAEESAAALVELVGVTYTTPSGVAAKHELRTVLKMALDRMPADYARVIRLYDLSGLSAADVAAELGRSEGAVYMLRARAHDRLREMLPAEAGFFSSSP